MEESINTATFPDADVVSTETTEPAQQDEDSSLLGLLNDDNTESEAPAEPLFKVKINGEEKDVTKAELIANYQKEQAAQQKFEEAAKIRREAEQQREQYLQHQQLMQQAIRQIQTQAQQWAQQEQPDWQDLLDNNPHEYLRQKELYEKRTQTLQQAQAAQAYLQQQQQIQQTEMLQQHLQVEGERLVKDYLPEWKDQAKRQKDEQDLISFLKEQGYNDQDLQNLNHSRASNIALAVKAMKYDQLLKKAEAAKKATPPEAATLVGTVGGKAGASKDPSSMTDAEFAEWRRAQRRR